MLWRAPEAELLPLCAAIGISQIVWSPLAQGVLTGKYRAGQEPPADSRAANSEMNISMNLVMNDATLEAVDRLRPIAEGAGLSITELARAWVLRRPEVASAIVGTSRPEQVHANAEASGIELTPETLAAIDDALGGAPGQAADPGATRAGPGSPIADVLNLTNDITEFLTSRRAKITPESAGLPTYGKRRVPGLRREEVGSTPSRAPSTTATPRTRFVASQAPTARSTTLRPVPRSP